MQLPIYQELIRFFILSFCICCGIFLGFIFKKHCDLQKQNKYQFAKIDSGILRLDTSTGSVSLIRANIDEKEILFGKKFADPIGTFGLIELSKNSYIVCSKRTGYITVVNLPYN